MATSSLQIFLDDKSTVETAWTSPEHDQENKDTEEDLDDFYHHIDDWDYELTVKKPSHSILIILSSIYHPEIPSPPPEIS